MAKQSRKERIRERRRRQRARARIIWGLIALAGIIVVGALVWQALRPVVQPAVGEEVPIMDTAQHVPEGADPGPFNSDPPTSGRHYASQLFAGFYDEAEAAEYEPYPAGYIVHSLEHGYVIFWYNCQVLEQGNCEDLKGEIREVIDRAGNFKVIGFPWSSTDVPVVATSWGRLLRFETFDREQALDFVSRNRNQAPEPQAP